MHYKKKVKPSVKTSHQIDSFLKPKNFFNSETDYSNISTY